MMPRGLEVSLAGVLVALCISGCGGGGVSGSASTTAPEKSPSGATSKATSGDTGDHFPVTEMNEEVVKFGEQASATERKAASAVLEQNLEARAAANFAKQCKTLSRTAAKEVAGQRSNNPAADCPSALRLLAEPLSGTREIRKDTLDGLIAELRVEGSKGYALYHGNDGKDYSMLMEKEGAAWKVGSVLTEAL